MAFLLLVIVRRCAPLGARGLRTLIFSVKMSLDPCIVYSIRMATGLAPPGDDKHAFPSDSLISAPMRGYGAIDTSFAAIEMTGCGDDHKGCEEGQDLAESVTLTTLNTSRLLTVYQIALVALSLWLYTTGWLGPTSQTEPHSSPALHVHSVNSLSEAFVVDKQGLTSFPDLVFFQFEGGPVPWFGHQEPGVWMWSHGILYIACLVLQCYYSIPSLYTILPQYTIYCIIKLCCRYAAISPAILHAVSGGIMDPVIRLVTRARVRGPRGQAHQTQ